ncbi:MAG: hypothetical protein A2Z16_03660 [Chloroflexi bacterium RBG_16_54_18]|nr:MAG: hypothetical protein A2Z16_03660 [Chloroflexi bacterium RBG_16_54_18]
MLKKIPVITFLAAGLIHLFLAPEHFEHSPAHGIFFIVAGLLEILWALLYWRRPSSHLYNLGIALAGGLVVLWALTRIVIPPFEESPAPVDLSGMVCKLCELAGAAALVTLALQGQVDGFRSTTAVRIIGRGLLLAIVSGLSFYVIGLAAEPLFPALAGSGHGAEDGETHSMGEMEHSDETQGENQVQTEPVSLPGGYQISGAWARPGASGDNSAAYFTINNPTPIQDHLVGASSSIAREAQVHLSEVDANGVANMHPQEAVEIPAGWQVTFEPGGLHVMLIDLQQDLEPGEVFTLTLEFVNAGSVDIQVEVQAP